MGGILSGSQIDNSGIMDRYPTGHVLQLVRGEDHSQLGKTTTAYEDVGLSAAITPHSITNTIFIQWNQQMNFSGSGRGMGTKLLRDDGGGFDEIFGSESGYDVYSGGNTADERVRATWFHSDVPAVLVACTYKVQVGNYNTNNVNYNDVGQSTSIILMEIVS